MNIRTRNPKTIAGSELLFKGVVMTDDGMNGSYEEDEPTGAVITERKVSTKRPRMYKVLLHNDDFTPMEFVVEILERFFEKTHTDATEIMLNVHHKGIGVCGIYPYEIAETKVAQVLETAREQEHPLQCTLEPEEKGDDKGMI